MSKMVMIVDIDTTIANNEHRASLLDKECVQCLTKLGTDHRASCPSCGGSDHRISQSSWDQFLSPDLILQDTPVEKAQEVLYRMRELGMPFHFITGRNESLREPTEQWLTEHFGWQPYREALCMRSAEHRGLPASVYKVQALQRLIYERSLPDCSFLFMEDDPFVFRAYQQYGIVLKCPEAWEHWMPEPMTGHEPSWTR